MVWAAVLLLLSYGAAGAVRQGPVCMPERLALGCNVCRRKPRTNPLTTYMYLHNLHPVALAWREQPHPWEFVRVHLPRFPSRRAGGRVHPRFPLRVLDKCLSPPRRHNL